MKQKLLMLCLTLVSLSMLGFARPVTNPYGQESEYFEPEYGDETQYTSDNGYSYDDAYSSVDWDTIRDDEDLYYSYYDDENVFMVVVGHRIYIVPYDFFYYRIWPRHRYHFRYCHYDYFSDWWGISFYNRMWYRYNYRHYSHSGYYRRYHRNHNFYRDHTRRPRTVIHKDGWRAPGNRGRNESRPRNLQQNRTYRDKNLRFKSGDSRIRSSDTRTIPSRRIIRSRSSDRYRSHDRQTTTGNRSYRSDSSSYRLKSGSRSSSSGSSSRSSSSSSRSASSGSRSGSNSSSKGTAVKKK